MIANSPVMGDRSVPLDNFPLDLNRLLEKKLPARDLEPGAATSATRGLAKPSRRRPLARFSTLDEGPSFYLSMSDLMSMLLVFFVLIFSLTDTGRPIPTQPVENAEPNRIMGSGAESPYLLEGDPFPNPQPMPDGFRQGILAVSGPGQGDPGLLTAEVDRDTLPSGSLVNRSLLSLVGSAAPMPAEAIPTGGKRLAAILGNVCDEPSGMMVEGDDEKVVLRMPESITFDLGKSVIRSRMLPAIDQLARILKEQTDAPVMITGHTDDLPIHNAQFASNWELSGARAAAVARALIERGVEPDRILIQGLADKMPLAPNTDGENRQINRRVELKIELFS